MMIPMRIENIEPRNQNPMTHPVRRIKKKTRNLESLMIAERNLMMNISRNTKGEMTVVQSENKRTIVMRAEMTVA